MIGHTCRVLVLEDEHEDEDVSIVLSEGYCDGLAFRSGILGFNPLSHILVADIGLIDLLEVFQGLVFAIGFL